MILYHGSNTFGLKTLEPKPMELEKPYVMLSTLEIIAGFQMINAVEEPDFWFPYGFNEMGVPQYHELYPNALREAAEGKRGCIYTVEADEETIVPLKGVPDCKLSAEKLKVVNCLEIEDCYEWLMEEKDMGSFSLCRFEEKDRRQLRVWYNSILRHIAERKMINTPNRPYARFVQEKFPKVWADYEKLCKSTR